MAKKKQLEHEEDYDPENIRDLTDLFIKESREQNSTFTGKQDNLFYTSLPYQSGCKVTNKLVSLSLFRI